MPANSKKNTLRKENAMLSMLPSQNALRYSCLSQWLPGAAIMLLTLVASTKKGTRPSFANSAPPAEAEALYQCFVELLATATARPVATGRFAAHMDVSLVNDGPVTITIDSQRRC